MTYNARMQNAGDTPVPFRLTISGAPITLKQLDSAWGSPLQVTISAAMIEKIGAGRAMLEHIANGPALVYGVNTGVGTLCRERIPFNQLAQLQENLIISHAVGVGPPTPDEIVRWMMLFKIQGLGYGLSGVRRETVECLLGLLNNDILPVIPSKGSLGASGDLAPLAHMVLPMIGRGQFRYRGEVCEVAASMGPNGIGASGVQPIRLAAKEGLALINGTQFMAAYGAALVVRSRRLVKLADIIASMSLEALKGSIRPFDPRLHVIRPHLGAIETANNLRHLTAGSEILESHANCDKVQDPYSLRCVAPVHGATRDVVRHVGQIVETEINSVTDNPIIFDAETAISGGNFHGQPLALPLDYLAIGLAELASISERRTYLLLSGHDELPTLLMSDTGLHSGFMILQYTAAALVSENKIFAHPASVDSIPTSLGQEDHVSMGATAAVKAWQVLDNVETVLAVEMLCAAQALDFRLPLKAGVGSRLAHQIIRRAVPHCVRDREFREDIDKAIGLVRSPELISEIQQVLGEFF